jgi:ribosomal protein S18 acetylase RimI-like enzyme
VIRPAIPDDAEAMRDVVHAAYAHYVPRLGKPPGPMLDDYAARIAAGQAWVLQDAARVVGLLVLEDRPDALLLDNVAVRPECQGAGHGRALMAFTATEARRRGFRRIVLYTHVLMTENQELYRRIGYVETRRVTEHGFDRVYMQLDLAPA